jgi:uncharacterized protein YqjF (DUF2071 family)
LLNLPYYLASMNVAPHGPAIRYESRRKGFEDSAILTTTYQPAGAVFRASQGSLEYFLAERYCLYHVDRGGAPYRLEIHHPPWRLQIAEAEFARNGMAEASGLRLPEAPPLLHFAKRQDMVAWMPQRLT